MEFTAVIESAEEGGNIAFCPEVPGANGQGETVEDAKQNLAEAVELLTETMPRYTEIKNNLARKICRRLSVPELG